MAHDGILELELTSGSDLKNVEFWGKQDPYCVLACNTSRARSVTHTDGGRNPAWNQTFVFKNVCAKDTLSIEIFDENFIVREKKIGSCKVKLCQVAKVGIQNLQAPVFDDGGRPYGFLSLKLRYRSQERPVVSPPPTQARRITDSDPVEQFTVLYSLGPVISRDAFGATYQVTNKHTGKPFACEVVSKRRLRSEVEREALKQEIIITRSIQTLPNVVRFEQSFEDAQHVYIITESCSGGVLFQRLGSQGYLSEYDAASVMRDVLGLLANIHAKGIAHRALSPDCLMYASSNPDAKVKVGSWGFAAQKTQGESFFDMVGEVKFRAPEMLRKNYGLEVDIWSCGVVLYAMLSGRYPFTGKTERETCEAILRSEIDLASDPWPKISTPAKDLVRRMLVRDPATRPSATELLSHQWVVDGGVAARVPIHAEVVAKLKNFGRTNKFALEAQMAVAQSLTTLEIRKLEDLFTELDRDKSGSISLKEFMSVIQTTKAMKEEDVQALMAAADSNGDGTLDYHEFVAAALQLEKLNREDKFKEAFEQFDLDGNGVITEDELNHALKVLKIGDVDDLLSKVDKDQDGQIDYREFCSLMADVIL